MRKVWTIFAALLVVAWAGRSLAADKEDSFFFKKGDRIVFLGDSITEQYQYSTYIELYLTTRFPTWDLTFLNAGIGGDTATGGARRFASHVLAEKPTAVTIDFGMNDGGYGKFDEKRNERFVKNTEAMLEAAKKAKVRVALISPNAVDRRVNKGRTLYLETQKQFYAPLKDIAAKFSVPFVDQYAVTRAVLEKLEKEDAKTVRPFGDSVHTSPSGGLLMAHTILTGLKAPALVSDVTIDAANGKAQTRACKVTQLKSAANRVTFERTDDALPLPVQENWVSILPYVNQLKGLNWYGLKVTGLTKGKYNLLIDGKDVDSYSAEQLAEGVNLGNVRKGPLYDQGNKVFKAIGTKNDLVHKRFRSVVMNNRLDPEKKKEDLAKRMEQISKMQADIYKLVKPASHQFELKPAE
jgi:lysophospholipase L1-like esterase